MMRPSDWNLSVVAEDEKDSSDLLFNDNRNKVNANHVMKNVSLNIFIVIYNVINNICTPFLPLISII